MRLFKIFIPLTIVIGYLILVSYPYIFSKINRFDSLGLFSAIEEKTIDLEQTFSQDRTTDKFDNRMFAGEKVTAKIRASENNFGILLFRFAKLSSKVTDTVTFRIKKEGEDKWYYEHNYRANQFQPDQYFTFGFPSIINSRGNVYVFEIESLAGTYKNGTGVSLKKPQSALVYKYNRSDLKNLNTLFSFISKKTVYAANNADFFTNWQLLAAFLMPYIAFLFLQRKKIRVNTRVIIKFLPNLEKNNRKILKIFINKTASYYLSLEKDIAGFTKKTIKEFTTTKLYLLFLTTDTKKKIAIGLLIFLLALAYRFSSSLVNQDKLFYAGLGGQGDYDQFIRAATCAIKSFCPAILGQNFLFESTILGIFYEVFGFIGGLKAYLYLMMILSALVATIPHFLLSRKIWISIGGIIGSLFLATSDFLTMVSLNFTPDNGSTFTFSLLFIIYLLTLHFRTIRWLLLLGIWGTIDGLNKALFLINNPVAFGVFAPIFFYEKVREKIKDKRPSVRKLAKALFKRQNINLLFLSMVPLLVFLALYIAWEIFVYIYFDAYYWLRGLIATGGKNYVYYTTANESSFLLGGIVYKLFYLVLSAIVMVKRVIQFMDIGVLILAPIFLGMFVATVKRKFSIKKLITAFAFSTLIIVLLLLIKENYFKIHDIFPDEYIFHIWKTETYVEIFLFLVIIFLFILNFGFTALKLTLPIIPYVIMLIVLTKNSPFSRIWTQVGVWTVVLLAFLTEWLIINIKIYNLARVKVILSVIVLLMFAYLNTLPKFIKMVAQLNSGNYAIQNQAKYLRWVNSELPENAVVLAGGKSDLVMVAENIKRPVIYSALWTAAILVEPNEIPGAKSEDFGLTGVKFLSGKIKIPKVGATDFSIVSELKSKGNFKRKKYVILEDDVSIWRDRVVGVIDNLFSSNSEGHLNGEDYSLKVYKYNQALKKGIYELHLRDKSI